MKQPNFLLISIDTLRADRLGCYGCEPTITPNLDRMAANSLVFGQAISGGSWTQAAFPVLLTSTYASMYGGCLGKLSADRPSPIEELARSGYDTSGFSTSPLLSKDYHYDRGFDKFFDLIPDEQDPFLRSKKGGQRLLRSKLTHQLLQLLGQQMRPARIYSSATTVVNEFMNWRTGASGPYFSWLHLMDTHWPYHLEEALDNPAAITQAWNDMSIMHLRANRKIDAPISASQSEHFIDLYETSLQYLDGEMGRLYDFLSTLEQESDTVIIIVSDHGEEFLEHGRWGHWESNLYDEIIRVPLIIRLPGLKEPKFVPEQVRLLDIMPTVLELAGCGLPEGLEGKSMVSLWDGAQQAYRVDESISEMKRDAWHRVAIRTEAHKFIWDSKNPDHPELYDLVKDPGETTNISNGHPDLLTQFNNSLKRHLDRVAATQKSQSDELHVSEDEEIIRRLRDLGYVE